ncbi:type I-E CRISPR-associated protein Cse2/CasB [Acrocarpospora catenulata]|uniref:type I-E CRISPR-associated protein Cse2/CasB n=1 Tax=Acrocarpospora catenulata TaxID=2836182 RepID=UPI001BD95A19|nr:type I-E CRISPR-associated protein Cse2/CasB [Acrocarpospora catenulata]
MSDPLGRVKYINYLHGLQRALQSDKPHQVADARRTLAQLRHSFVEGRQYQAYEIVFQHAPPLRQNEAEVWLLVGGLFALHPLIWKDSGGAHSFGASLGKLRKKLDSPAVDRRLTVLLAKDGHSLPHHVRQAVRLLSAHDVPVHYRQLLDDLVVLLGEDHRGDVASRVRLRWAQEYYLPTTAASSDDADATDLSETE